MPYPTPGPNVFSAEEEQQMRQMRRLPNDDAIERQPKVNGDDRNATMPEEMMRARNFPGRQEDI